MHCRCGKDFCYKCGGVYLKCECGKLIAIIFLIVEEQRKRMEEQRKRMEEQRKRMKEQRMEEIRKQF